MTPSATSPVVQPVRRRRVGRAAGRKIAARAVADMSWLVVASDTEEVRAVRDATNGNVRRVNADEIVSEIEACDGPVAVVTSSDDSTLLSMSRQLTQAPVPIVVADRQPTLDRAVLAVQRGACDYVPSALVDAADLQKRLRRVAGKAWSEDKFDRRLDRLRAAVRTLNIARRAVSQKVDVLCNDFVDGYGDVAKQVEEVRLGGHLRSLLGGAADLEQLLCHTMDWLLRHAGHCNIAIFLDDDEGRSELGAYMKHTVAGEAAVVEWLSTVVLPRVEDETEGAVFRAEPEAMLPEIDVLDAELSQLVDHVVLAARCTYLAEPLATIVLTRRDDKPLGDRESRVLQMAAEAFAGALTAVVRQGEPDLGTDSEEDEDDGEEWWQRGDNAPY